MSRRTPLTLTAIALAAGLVATASARAATTHIRDDAKLFSPAVQEQAEEEARDLAQRFHVNVVVETFPAAPWLARLSHNLKDRAVRDRFLSGWAERRSKRAGSEGVYVLVCKEPAPAGVEVRLGSGLHKGKLTLSGQDADGLRNVLLSKLEARHADEGLLDALRFLRARLEATAPAVAAGWELFPWVDMLGIILVLGAFWVCVEAIQLVSAGRAESPAAPALGPSAGSYPAALFAALTTYGLGQLLRAALWAPPSRPVEAVTTSQVLSPPVPHEAPTLAGDRAPSAAPPETATRD